MNPKSGGGKAERFHLVDECRARGIEPIVLQRATTCCSSPRTRSRAGADVIGMAGGDGSQALVADRGPPPRHPARRAPGRHPEPLRARPRARPRGRRRRARRVRRGGRAARSTWRRSTAGSSSTTPRSALYAKIVQSQEYRDAKLKTAADMLPDMLGPDAEPFDLRFRGPTATEYAYGAPDPGLERPVPARPPGRARHARADGPRRARRAGVPDRNAAEAVQFVGLERGRPGCGAFAAGSSGTAPRFQIDSNAPVEIGIDGEAMLMDPPLVFESMPAALRVRLPSHASGRSPAARRISSSTPGQLWRIAASGDPSAE